MWGLGMMRARIVCSRGFKSCLDRIRGYFYNRGLNRDCTLSVFLIDFLIGITVPR
jgi:hypothetical protein